MRGIQALATFQCLGAEAKVHDEESAGVRSEWTAATQSLLGGVFRTARPAAANASRTTP